LIFSYFNVPAQYQHRVLFWGIIGALIFRAIFIALGALLIAKFHAIIYLFGAFLVFTGLKMAWAKDKQIHPERNPVLRLFKKMVAVTTDYRGRHFFVREGGRWLATPLFVVLTLIESSDIIFAVDSIPAIFAVTKDPYIVFTANVFAILGLRSLYFALAGVMQLFHHLHYGLSIILVFVGVKMVLSDIYKIPIGVSLGAVALIIAGSIAASLIWPRKDTKKPEIVSGVNPKT
jgi:tellurite resistance protein TerC